MMTDFRTCFAFALLVLHGTSLAKYTEEETVKLLQVKALANRFQAADSKYRTSLTGGHDEDAHRTEGEILNGMPELRMVLEHGGCATYVLPIESDQKYIMVQPARKQGTVYEDYCNKGTLDVVVSNEVTRSTTKFECFPDTTSCSAESCHGDITALLTPDLTKLHINICNKKEGAANKAAIWELKLSSSHESDKILALFGQSARLRLRGTQDDPKYDTHLSMVSVVGSRGVGKSTIASLLSGNASMFLVGSGSVGTTTEGADISTVLPTVEWVETMKNQLGAGVSLTSPGSTLPLFLIDSEGMGIRGDEFDFITTSPPAIVSKVVIWVGNYNLQTVQVLNDIAEYVKGLDSIVMNEGDVSDDGLCRSGAKYGHLIVVINKMMGSDDDEKLTLELLTKEPDYIEGAQERNLIRDRMKTCFNGVSVHGLPAVSIKKDLTYDILPKRFKEGLGKMVNTVIDKTLEPRTVTVGDLKLELNSTNAEVIIGTVIDEANSGSLDLTGFGPFWGMAVQKVSIMMDEANIEMDKVKTKCAANGRAGEGCTCSSCVCSYRNKKVTSTKKQIEEILDDAANKAGTLFGVDASENIKEVLSNVVNPWEVDNKCTKASPPVQMTEPVAEVCDSSEMVKLLSTPAAGLSFTCDILMICDTIDIGHVKNGAVTFTAGSIYLGGNPVIDLKAPAKAADGSAIGQSGSPGLKGLGLTVKAKGALDISEKAVTIFARGGDGGNGKDGKNGVKGANGAHGKDGAAGGNGAPGTKGTDATSVPSSGDPTTAQAVVDYGQKVRDVKTNCHHHCVCQVVTCDYFYHYELNKVSSQGGGNGGHGGDGKPGGAGTNGESGKPGEDGGNGGNGGKGGEPGQILFQVPTLSANVQKLGGKGGNPGKGGMGGAGGVGGTGGKGGPGGHGGAGGNGGLGKQQAKNFKGYHMKHEKYRCNVFHCGHDGESWSYGGYQKNFGALTNCCTGQPGNPGKEGAAGKNGANGAMGAAGKRGKDGLKGADGKNVAFRMYYSY